MNRKRSKQRAPAFQFYAADYLADESVALMTLEEEGAYTRAIAYCWREGSLPADPGLLSRLLKNAPSEVVRTVVRKFEEIDAESGKRLIHPKLEAERKKQRDWARKSIEGGKASGNARRKKTLHAEPKANQNTNGGSQMVEPKANSSFASSSSSSFSETLKAVPSSFVVPEWVPRVSWEGWLEARKKKGIKNTDRALQIAVGKLDKLRAAGDDPTEVLDEATYRGWTGLFPLKSGNGGTSVVMPALNSIPNGVHQSNVISLTSAREKAWLQ